MRRLATRERILAALLLTLLLLLALLVQPSSLRETPPGVAYQLQAQAYPHLANYNGLQVDSQVPFYSGYGLIIARRGAPVQAIKRANPHAIVLLYERTLQVDLCCSHALYGLWPTLIPPQWWLVESASTLLQPLSPHQTTVYVKDSAPFARCQDIMIGTESMHVWSVSGHTLHVLRGYYSKAQAHRAEARVTIHYSYRRDLSNCWQPRQPTPSIRPWSLNLSSHCPVVNGQRWVDYLAHYVTTLVQHDGWDGVFYDNMFDFPPSAQVITDSDGRADGGVVHGVNVWRAGERELLALTRRLMPDKGVMINGDLQMTGLAEGREMEGFPLIPGLALNAALDAYLYDTAQKARLTIVNPDTVSRPTPNLAAMDLSVGLSALGDGYVAYDYGWLTHGAPWWFDEFDHGAGSATLQTVPPGADLIPVVHPQRFSPGDTILIDAEAARVERVLKGALLVQRGVWGTVPALHLPRTTVTTLTQRQRSIGYLGLPLGPARLVPTDDWTRYQLPLKLQRGPARVNGEKQHSTIVPITPRTQLSVSATTSYDPFSSALIFDLPYQPQRLWMLSFYARGPEGESIWLHEGEQSVPLVLRQTWHRYDLPIDSRQSLRLGVGRVHGTVQLKGLTLTGVQAFVWKRDFTRGAVVVNTTDVVQHLTLSSPLAILAGDQNPWLNTGHIVKELSLGRYRAAILLRPELADALP